MPRLGKRGRFSKVSIYGCYKSHGVELIVHHGNSYAANLLPSMIEMGVDIWQGCVTTINVPELVKKYGGEISFMCDIKSGVVDREDWTRELVECEVRTAWKQTIDSTLFRT